MTRKEKEAQIRFKVEEALDRPLGVYAGNALVEFVLTELEAAGKQWDPEEKPFPERLKVSQFGDLQYEDGPIMLTIRDKREVVRRWNAFPTLRSSFRRWQAAEYGDCFEDDFFADVIERMLGKEGS